MAILLPDFFILYVLQCVRKRRHKMKKVDIHGGGSSKLNRVLRAVGFIMEAVALAAGAYTVLYVVMAALMSCFE